VKLPAGAAKNSEIIVTFALPKTAATLSVTVGHAEPATTCSVDYVPGAKNVSVSCGAAGGLEGGAGGLKDTVPMLPSETTFEIRVFSDATFLEAFFQQGRAAMTAVSKMSAATELSVGSSVKTDIKATAWPMKGIWTTEAAVRAAPRVYK
jgi:hypothetical protein